MSKINSKKLTEKQKRFCLNYAERGFKNATKAAVDAGYKVKNAKVTASKLLTKANVQGYVNRLKTEITSGIDDVVIDRRFVLQVALRNLTNAEKANKHGAVVDYLKIIGNHVDVGAFDQRISAKLEHSGAMEQKVVLEIINSQ